MYGRGEGVQEVSKGFLILVSDPSGSIESGDVDSAKPRF